MMRPTNGGPRAAFTLVEVLAALTLAAVILPVAMRGISLATAAAGDAKRQMEAASLAEAKLAELRVSGEWQGTELSGDCGTDWPAYRWSADVTEWDGVSIQQLSVSVEWTARNRTRAVTLATLVYQEEGK
ncbi:MAG TPA: type II secretion system protein [Planctomycetota bacterium]|nr:type II secretion system protein [Planctomycetota bacterium]